MTINSLYVQTYQKILSIFFLSVSSFLIAVNPEKESEAIYCNAMGNGEFQEIAFAGSGSFEVTLDRQNGHSCIICTDSKWLSLIKKTIEKKRLNIIAPLEMPKYKSIQCAIAANEINLILAKDAADVQIKTKIQNTEKLELWAFGKAKIVADVNVPHLAVAAVDSSQIETVGTAEHQKVNLEFQASYDGQNCQAKTIDVKAKQNSFYLGFITKDDDEKNLATVTILDKAHGLIKGKIDRLVYSCPRKKDLRVIGVVTHLERKINSNHELFYEYSENVEPNFKKLINLQQKRQNKKYLKLQN